ncbi:MAG: hypothetical protein ACR2G7_04660 [Acidimicrobiales bacterium]
MRPPDDHVIAWRYWQVPPGPAVLRSVTQKHCTWSPGQRLTAICVGVGHDAPAEGCACGIYGSGDLGSLRDHGLCLAPDMALVVGQVGLWGTVLPDGHGYRAQYAYPRELALVQGSVGDDVATVLTEGLGAYGVPVRTTTLHQAVGDVSAAVLAFQAMSATTRARG